MSITIKNFNTKIEEELKKLIKLANKSFPLRTWFTNIILWQDTDYQIDLVSTWGKEKNIFRYRKAEGTYSYIQQRGRSIEEEILIPSIKSLDDEKKCKNCVCDFA